MINVGGWLLLTFLFSSLLMLVQRAERNRRLATLIIMMFTASLVSGYGIYRMANACDLFFSQLCALEHFKERARVIAYNTTNLAVFTAIAVNFLFWFVIGRYNPPGSSKSIKVYGLDDGSEPTGSPR